MDFVDSMKGDKRMNEEFRKMLSEMVGQELEFDGFKDAFEGDGLDNNLVTSLMLCKQLKRIADVLEDINGTLISMSGDIESLGECVGYVPSRHKAGQGTNFLRIGGSVDAGI